MQRWTAAVLGVLLAAALVIVVWQSRRGDPVEGAPAHTSSASPLPGVASADASDGGSDGGVTDAAASEADAATPHDFRYLSDGGIVPPLPADAPSSVRIGVILFRYRGAQLAPDDAPSKSEALERALRTLPLALKDFDQAVTRGDVGLTDAGRIERGNLEPAVEHVVFSLEPGEIHDAPVDTPRGYWIVRRNP